MRKSKRNDEQPTLINKIFKNKKVRSVIIIAVLLIAVFAAGRITAAKTTISTKSLNQQLQVSSDLITAKLTYEGWSKYEDSGKIPLLTKGGFILVYDVTVTAGIDIEKVEVTKVDNNKKIIYINLPKATIIDTKVDPESVQYFDEKFKLLNFDEKENANKAIALAEDDAEAKAEESGILELADQQSETLIKGLLAELSNGYKFEFTKV